MTSRPADPPDAGASRRGPLPTFRAPEAREQAALEASRAIVALFLREGSTDLPIKELADHAGLSERTFYRWFPRKEDAVRPYLRAAIDHVVAQVRVAGPDVGLRAALVAAHGALLDAGRTHDGAVMVEVLQATDRLRAVWLQVLTDAETAFAGVIAERLGLAPDALQARLAGALVVAAGRLALQSDDVADGRRAASEVFAASLDLLGPALFETTAPEVP